jgi:hypothetical protein
MNTTIAASKGANHAVGQYLIPTQVMSIAARKQVAF